jgi:hypothetical protein
VRWDLWNTRTYLTVPTAEATTLLPLYTMSVDLERTPLLENQDAPLGNNLHDHGSTEDVYSRFNARQRRSILFLVAFAGLITSRTFDVFRASDC